MGFIREPEGVDFFVKSRPLTERERKEISEYIANYKKKALKKKITAKQKRKLTTKRAHTRRKAKATA